MSEAVQGGVVAGHVLHHHESIKPVLAAALVGSVVLAWILFGR